MAVKTAERGRNGRRVVKTVLLTGATGFVGSHIAAGLVRGPWRLHLLVRRRTPALQALGRAGARIVVSGEGDAAAIGRALTGVDTVIHCAGATRAVHRRTFYRVNIGYTESILRGMEAGQRMVFISSQAAAGPSRSGRPVDEAATCRPVNDYGKSKLLAENAIHRWARDRRLSYCILRPCAVYGPRDLDFYQMFRWIHRRIRFLPPDPSQRISLVHVLDLVRAVMVAAGNAVAGKRYFVAAGAHSWKDISAAAEKALRPPALLTIRPPAALLTGIACVSEGVAVLRGRPSLINRQKIVEMKQPAWVCSSRRLRHDTQWSPCLSLESGIAGTIDWYRRAGML
jgi:nucleoside-diphosphate-sugar epimerase